MVSDRLLWFVVLVFWGVGDTATTVVAVGRYGVRERNLLMRRVFERYGIWSAIPAKAIGLGVMYTGWFFLERPVSTYVLAPVAALGVCVTVWNTRQIARARSAAPPPLRRG